MELRELFQRVEAARFRSRSRLIRGLSALNGRCLRANLFLPRGAVRRTEWALPGIPRPWDTLLSVVAVIIAAAPVLRQ